MALEPILDNKRAEVAMRKIVRPLASFQSNLAPSTRSFKDALKKGRTGFIFECKKASPSKGLIRADFDPKAIASTYSKYADAISVLADEKFFLGSLEYVRAVSEAVEIPVLCKDFTVDPYQVYEARLFCADAVLLMLSVLDDETYRQCADACRSLQMDALTEVHDEAELKRALNLEAEIIGINNRSFKDLSVDLGVSRRLLPLIPKNKVTVVESGISSHREIISFRKDCDGFLVGSKLMAEDDLDKACRMLVYGNVKVCGLTSTGDARAAYNAGARYGGLIFAEVSPRYVTRKTAAVVREAAPLDWVGVFVNTSLEQVVFTARSLSLKTVQLHGDETPSYIEALRHALPHPVEIWKSVSVGKEKPHLDGTGADRVLLDTASKKMRGGTGERFDWRLIKGESLSEVVLSGGLGPDSAKDADNMGAFALDVNSGVEDAPGKKNQEKLARFFAALRGSKG
jgi:indole-3-glycerol phosphate synthase/phosphoribosylanthranilate isomerase